MGDRNNISGHFGPQSYEALYLVLLDLFAEWHVGGDPPPPTESEFIDLLDTKLATLEDYTWNNGGL